MQTGLLENIQYYLRPASTPLDWHITIAVKAKGQLSSQFGEDEPQGKKDNPGQYEKRSKCCHNFIPKNSTLPSLRFINQIQIWVMLLPFISAVFVGV